MIAIILAIKQLKETINVIKLIILRDRAGHCQYSPLNKGVHLASITISKQQRALVQKS